MRNKPLKISCFVLVVALLAVASGPAAGQALPPVSIADASAVEGSPMAFAVTIPGPQSRTVTVSYSVSSGTAVAGSDFLAVSGSVTIPAGSTSAPVTVQSLADSLPEGDEVFFVNLANPVNAVLGRSLAQGTVRDDDRPPMTVRADFEPWCSAEPWTDLLARSPGFVPRTLCVDSVVSIAPPVDPDTEPTDVIWRNPGGLRMLTGTFPDLHEERAQIVVDTVEVSHETPRAKVWATASRSWHAIEGSDDLGTDWSIVGVADFNHDGSPDLLWLSASGDLKVGYLTFDPVKTSFTQSTPVSTTPSHAADANWRVAGTGDFDRDGRPDILWRNQTSGALVAWFMDGTVRTGAALLDATVPDATWSIIGLWDADKNGSDDVVLQSQVSKRLVVWLMDGTHRVSGTYLNGGAPLDGTWRIVGPR